MRWHNERINHEVAALQPGLVHDVVLIDLLRRMRDDYEQAMLNQRAETITLAKRVAELETAMVAGVRERQRVELRFDRYAENANRIEKIKDAETAELRAQLAAALATIERAAWCDSCNMPEEHCRENHGVLYAEGCAP